MPLRPPAAALWLSCLLPLAPIGAGGAQPIASLDAGYARVQFTGFQGSGALTLAPTLQFDHPVILARAAGSFSRFESARWSSSGSAGVSAFSPVRRGLRAEVAASGNATAYRGTRTAQMLGQARVHVHADSMGGWLGAGRGSSRYGAEWQPHTLLDAGAWVRSHGLTMTVALASATYTFWDSTTVLTPDGGGGLDTSYNRLHRTGYLTDAIASIAWAHGALDLDLSAGMRPISRYDAGDRRWATLTATAWIRPGLAIVGSGGRHPENPLQNLAGSDYASLAIRIGGRPRVRQPVPEPVSANLTDFTIVSGQSGLRTVYVQAPGARSVEIAAPFTGWTPRTLARVGRELWVLQLEIAPGTYDVVLRIDGGPWTPPPGLPAFDDEFAGRVGRLVIAPDTDA